MPDCSSDCKFCTVHEVGVYVLNATSLLILSLVIAIYWRDILSFFRGNYRHKEQNTYDVPDAATFSQPNVSSNYTDQQFFSQEYPQLMKQSSPVIFQQPPVIFTAVPTISNIVPTSPPPLFSPKTVPETSAKEFDETVSPHESTGSRYFKHIMRGKKQVASISQYKVLKNHKKHKKHEKTGTKKHNHTQKHNRITKDEVHKFAEEAKALAKGLP